MSTNNFIKLIPLLMEHKESIGDIKSRQGLHTNAGSFVTNYLWRKAMSTKIYIESDMYSIKEEYDPANIWVFPIGECEAKKKFITELIYTHPDLIFLKVRDTDKHFLEEHFPDVFHICECPDDDEYIYDVVEYETLKGKKWRKFREAENRLKARHTVVVEPIDADNIHEVKSIMKSWAEGRSPGGYQNTIGDEIDDEIIKSYVPLGLIGVILKVDNRPVATAIGYPLSDDICDVAVMKYVKGPKDICRITLRAFMLHFKDKFRYFNFEEDGGIEGLRTIKKRLNPCRIEKMWKAKLKTQRR